MNVDVLGEIISFLNITEDKSILDIHKQLFNLSDNEKDQILKTWKNNSKYECKVFDDRKEWHVNGKIHREDDLPAVEREDGEKSWWVNGRLHRDADKPAVEYVDGAKCWFVNGRPHREDHKPVVENADGSKQWWVKDCYISGYSYEEYLLRLKKIYDLKQI
jgi:hypothetical protein